MAGEKLYGRIEIDHQTDWESIMQGVGLDNTKLGEANHEGTSSEDTTRPQITDYKRLLLEYVHTIVISHHSCPKISPASVKETAKLLTGLKRAILTSWADCSRSDCGECLFDEVLQYESLTIHDCRLDTLLHGHWQPFTGVLDRSQHATLVIPPTLNFLNDSAEDERDGAPLGLESLRLIFAHDRLDSPPWHMVSRPIASVESLIKFVAPCLKLRNWKIEIYIFNDFNNTLDLVDFRDKLKIEVDDAIKALPKKDRPDWSPNYQVYGLEDYFNHPDMYLELDHEWMMSWRMELDRRQRAQREEEKRIV
jgi:hypothetical protein